MSPALRDALKACGPGASLSGTLRISVENGSICEISLHQHDGMFHGQVHISRSINSESGADLLAEAARRALAVKDALIDALNGGSK